MKSLKNTLLVGASLLTVTAAQAATITWSSAEYTNTDSNNTALLDTLGTDQFSTTGTLIQAQNSGGNAETLGAISFDAGTLNLGGTAAAFYSINLPANNVGHTGTFGDGNGAATVTLGGANSASAVAADGAGGNLIIGETYRFQALILDGRGSSNIRGRTVSFDGVNQGVYANGVNGSSFGNALLVTGTFVADATTQTFTTEIFAPNGGASQGSQINAFTLSNVPEPSSTALLGLGGLALILRRRK